MKRTNPAYKSREVLMVELTAERTAHERLREEFELLRSNDMKDDWMTPGPDEVPDVRNIEDQLEPQPNAS